MEIKESAIEWFSMLKEKFVKTEYEGYIDMAISALEQQEKAFDEWCTDCKEYDKERHCCPRFNRVIRGAVDEVKQQGWIPVTERMPEENQPVLITDGAVMGVCSLVRTDDGYKWENNMGYWLDFDEWKAWTPLPEPYKEDKA